MSCPYSLARENDISVKKYDFEEFSGICGRYRGRAMIGVKRGLSTIEEREVVAHELGHIMDGTDDCVYFSHIAERRADRMAREVLIPSNELGRIIEEYEGNADCSILAPMFGVSFEFMQLKIKDICEQ